MKGFNIRENLKGLSKVLISIIIALVIGAIFLIVQGENPIEIYYYLLFDSLSSTNGVLKMLGKATPLIFTGLAVAISFKCGIFNCGVEGQLLFGGLASAIAGYYLSGLPAALHLILSILAGMAAGAVYAFIPAFLKIRFRVHEVISTIMLNNVANALITLLVVNYFRSSGPHARTSNVADSALLTQFKPPEQVNTGFFIAIAAVVAIYILLNKTPLGWRIDASGKNLESTSYSGINSKRVIIYTMLISGAVAGLCGVERVLGAYGYMELGFSPGYGFEGITVAVLARNNPIGCLIGALFIGLLQSGGVNINTMTNVPYEWVQALIAIIFILVAAQNGLFNSLKKLFTSKKKAVIE